MSEQRIAETVAPLGVEHLLRAEALLREMRYSTGGSLRLKAFQVQDAMRELVTQIDGEGA